MMIASSVINERLILVQDTWKQNPKSGNAISDNKIHVFPKSEFFTPDFISKNEAALTPVVALDFSSPPDFWSNDLKYF